jgi:anthranilate/para-aminobenzoate synthase component I
MGDAASMVARWPTDEPVLALVSPGGDSRERWSIVASPVGEIIDLSSLDEGVATLGRIHTDGPGGAEGAPPFTGGWIGWIGYGLGVEFEPTAQCARKGSPGSRGRGWLARCDAALVRDEIRGEWFGVGVSDAAVDRLLATHARSRDKVTHCRVGPFTSAQGREAYEGAVAAAIEYIRAGDIFQANIAHELKATFAGSTRSAFALLVRSAAPAFGAYLEPPVGVVDRRTVCSISPELFLDADFASRRVCTRPIKGTRRGDDRQLASDLRESEKDAAELAMIVDLMRNDLSRVCEVGSVRVDEPRAFERHGGGSVLHAVATVSGAMRAGVGFAELLRATFPPGSVTGAPKIRAMQIIDELEPFPRGAYCGAIGFISDSAIARMSVAIRTATIDAVKGEIVYPVGAGIVAESDPALEWDETLVKAKAITNAFQDDNA